MIHQEAATKFHGERVILDEVRRMLHAVGELPDRSAFGGAWIDNASGKAVVGFTRDIASYAPRMKAAARRPDLVEVAPVKRSLAELDALRERIIADRDLLKSSGVTVMTVGEKTDLNVVSLGVVEPFSRGRADLLAARYGSDSLVLRWGKQLRTTAGRFTVPVTKFYGGHHLVGPYLENPLFEIECTAGFTMYTDTGPLPGRQYYKTTSGHCYPFAEPVFHGRTTRQTVGQVTQNDFVNNSDADALEIRIDPTFESFDIIRAGGVLDAVELVEDTQIIGLEVCKSGITTDETCGFFVDDVHVTITYIDSGVTLHDQVQATGLPFAAWFGDSGGPVYDALPFQDGIVAEGLQSGIQFECDTQGNCSPDGTMFYSFQTNVELSLQLTTYERI